MEGRQLNLKEKKRMQLSIGKTKTATLFFIVLLMASTIAMLTVPNVAAEDPGTSGPPPAGVTYDTVTVTPHLSFRPNPVGVGQEFIVNIWTTPATHAARHHPNYTVVITKPDGTVDVVTMESYPADATAWFPYIADQEGVWQLQFIFPGTFFPGGTLTGGFMGTRTTVNPTYYKAVSTGVQNLTVQHDIVYSWPEDYMPTDYWTRPVHVENRQWWTIAGNWPATGYNGHVEGWDEMYPGCNPSWYTAYLPDRLIPWVEAPDSCHILWKRQDALAGLIGGQAGVYGTSGEPGAPSVIYAGRVYDSYTKPGLGSSTAGSTMFRCYDLRTGEVYWEYPCGTTGSGFFVSTLIPNLIEYNAPTQSEVEGAEAAGTWSVNLIRIQGSQLYKWNPWTGAMTANISISPLSGGTFYRQPTKRDELPLVLTVQRIGSTYWLINWTTSGTGALASRIQSNTSYALSSLPTMCDFESGYGAAVGSISLDTVYVGETITGYNLWTGEKIWNQTINEGMYSAYCDVADHGKIATLTNAGHYVCFDLVTGKKLWTSDTMDYPWSSAGFGGYTAFSAYGLIIREAYDGVYGFNWTTGKMEWHYVAPAASAYETPYIDGNGTTVMPFYSFGVGGIIADGKFFTWNYEHTESWPVTRGWSLHAIDVFTGEGVWNLTGCSTPRAIADGYLIATGWADGYTYIIGKGKSATTVTAPDTEIPLGQAIVIKGTVMDLSPAQPNTPCVSDVSMKTQMDYLHMQLPIGGIWGTDTMTGVEVSLTALDSNGNWENIGTVTSNAYYGTFSCTWTPPIEGDYTIVATFAGTASYSSSGASTAIAVGPAVSPYPTPIPPETPVDYMPMMYAILACVIVAIILSLVALFRKR
jgi:hypothetical protein